MTAETPHDSNTFVHYLDIEMFCNALSEVRHVLELRPSLREQGRRQVCEDGNEGG